MAARIRATVTRTIAHVAPNAHWLFPAWEAKARLYPVSAQTSVVNKPGPPAVSSRMYSKQWPPDQGELDVADDSPRVRAVDLGRRYQILGDRQKGRCEDDHPERCSDESVGEDHKGPRAPAKEQVSTGRPKKFRHELVVDAEWFRGGDSLPHQYVDDRWG